MRWRRWSSTTKHDSCKNVGTFKLHPHEGPELAPEREAVAAKVPLVEAKACVAVCSVIAVPDADSGAGESDIADASLLAGAVDAPGTEDGADDENPQLVTNDSRFEASGLSNDLMQLAQVSRAMAPPGSRTPQMQLRDVQEAL